MSRDPLQTLLSLRRHAIEQARYALGACLAAESRTRDRIDALDEAVRRDRRAADAWPDARLFQDMAAIRGDALRADRSAAVTALMEAETASAAARDAVAAARTAAEAVDLLIAARDAAGQIEAARQAQHALDDVTRKQRAVGRRLKP